MSKKALQEVIDHQNFFAKLTNKTEMDINSLSDTDANELYHSIDGHMSPENLHCDGEISIAQARTKARMYMGAVAQLEKMGFAMPEDVYEIA